MKSPSSHVCNGPLLCAELNAVQWPINHHTYQLGQGQSPKQRSVWNHNCNYPHTKKPGRVFPFLSPSMKMQYWRPAGGDLACIRLSYGCMHSLMGHSHRASFFLEYSLMQGAYTSPDLQMSRLSLSVLHVRYLTVCLCISSLRKKIGSALSVSPLQCLLQTPLVSSHSQLTKMQL